MRAYGRRRYHIILVDTSNEKLDRVIAKFKQMASSPEDAIEIVKSRKDVRLSAWMELRCTDK